MCGGRNFNSILSSCEVNVAGEDSWTITSGSLPAAVVGLRGVTLDNRVLMTG